MFEPVAGAHSKIRAITHRSGAIAQLRCLITPMFEWIIHASDATSSNIRAPIFEGVLPINWYNYELPNFSNKILRGKIEWINFSTKMTFNF